MSEEFGLTCSFATKTAKRSGKKQGMPGLTVQLNPAEARILRIQFSTETFFRKFFIEAVVHFTCLGYS